MAITIKDMRDYPVLMKELRWLMENQGDENVIRSIRDKIAEVDRFIYSIDDPIVRMGIRYVFLEDRTWLNAAIKIGGNNTAESVKRMCYRYIEKAQKKKGD